MDEKRLTRIILTLANSTGPGPRRLCTAASAAVAVTGAGITLMTDAGGPRMTVCVSDDVAQAMEELQFSLGEGPCVDAFALDAPVSEPDLAGTGIRRWGGFAPAALTAGAAAAFGFPLRAGGSLIGTLNLYSDVPGLLSEEQLADALVVADVIARQIAVIQSTAPSGNLAEDLVGKPGLRLVVHQASGMVAAQLEVDVHEALARLRARAFAMEVSVTTVATAVVRRELRFDDDWPTRSANKRTR